MQNGLMVLGVVMLIMKLADMEPFAHFSWWLILLPFYFWYAVVVVIAFFTFLCAGVIFVAAAFLSLFGL